MWGLAGRESPLHEYGERNRAVTRESPQGRGDVEGVSYSRQNEDGVDRVEGHSWGHFGCFATLGAAVIRGEGHEGREVESQIASQVNQSSV